MEYVLGLKGNTGNLFTALKEYFEDMEFRIQIRESGGYKRRLNNRYFISSLKEDIEELSGGVRGHWAIESMNWHLDLTFREDGNKTIDKTVG